MQKAGHTGSLNRSMVGSSLHFSEFVHSYCQLRINRLGILLYNSGHYLNLASLVG